MRAALYARVSTRDQSVDPQLADLRVLAQQRGWTAVEYTDVMTGSAEHRPGLDRMLEDVAAGKVQVVAVVKLDRLGRSLENLLAILQKLRAAGASFVSLRDQMDTDTPMGKMLFALLGIFAEFERDLIRERIRAGVAHAQATRTKSGKPFGRPFVDIDLRPAVALLREGRPLVEVASILRVNRATLRTRLREAGDPHCQQVDDSGAPETALEGGNNA